MYLKLSIHFDILTSLVPVQMGDVVHGSFTHANPLAAHHVVYVHKAVG